MAAIVVASLSSVVVLALILTMFLTVVFLCKRKKLSAITPKHPEEGEQSVAGREAVAALAEMEGEWHEYEQVDDTTYANYTEITTIQSVPVKENPAYGAKIGPNEAHMGNFHPEMILNPPPNTRTQEQLLLEYQI